MPNVAHHTHRPHQVHHNLGWYFMGGLFIAVALLLILTLLPVISFSGTAISPAYFREAAYLEYLQGEKVLFTNPVALNAALVEYHAGEKILYTIENAVWEYHLGEKSAVLSLTALNREDALILYRMGEKDLR